MSTVRLNVDLPEDAFNELKRLSESSGRSMKEIVRTGLGLAAVAWDESRKQNRLAVTDKNGQPIKEIIVPR